MKINVLAVDSLDLVAEAWRLSRDLSRDSVPLEEVVGVDVPVCEMASALLHFENFAIFEREIFTTPRNHSIWARTSHVDDSSAFVVPPDVAYDKEFADHQREKMRLAKTLGLSLDEYRFDMPIAAQTSWCQRMSFRDAVKMAKYLEYLSERVHLSLKSRIRKAGLLLEGVVDEFCEGKAKLADLALGSMRMEKFLHEQPVNGRAVGSVSVNGSMVMPMIQPLWMRAQIVRHRPLGFVDDFFRLIESADYSRATLSTPISMEVRTDVGFWRRILGKRTCWLAQDSLKKGKDLWQEIVDGTPGGFSAAMMPCADGTCPYEGDAALRLTDQDPGVPCPRYMNIKKIDKTSYVADMVAAARSRHPYWDSEIRS